LLRADEDDLPIPDGDRLLHLNQVLVFVESDVYDDHHPLVFLRGHFRADLGLLCWATRAALVPIIRTSRSGVSRIPHTASPRFVSADDTGNVLSERLWPEFPAQFPARRVKLGMIPVGA